jgi:hypothetical protein
MSGGVLRPGGFDPDDPPVVPRGSKDVAAPKVARKELNHTLEVPKVVGAASSSIPHAVPADVPQTYSQQRRYGPAMSYGGDNISGAPAIASPATAFQLAAGVGALWFLATKLSGK